MLKRSLIVASAIWADLASAKLPAAGEKGWGDLTLTVSAFFAVFLLFAVVGAVAARRLAPRSPEKRRIIWAGANFVGLVLGVAASRTVGT